MSHFKKFQKTSAEQALRRYWQLKKNIAVYNSQVLEIARLEAEHHLANAGGSYVTNSGVFQLVSEDVVNLKKLCRLEPDIVSNYMSKKTTINFTKELK